MIILEIAIYFLFFLLLTSYLIYPLTISIKKTKPRENVNDLSKESKIHLVIACYNEEQVIEEKIRNSFSIDYPREFCVYVVIDESSDRTSELAHQLTKEYNNLIVLDKGYRKGKNDSINYFFENIKPEGHDVLFFTDANTFYEKESFVNLWDKLEKGAVVVGGSMKYIDQLSNSAKSEGLYWRYEEWIRRNESRFGRTITMNGGNMAMIAKYFEELPLFVPNDFDIPIRLVSEYKTAFAENAIGVEKAILHGKEELTRKERMANRQMNAILLRWAQLSLLTKTQLIFHKVIRWLALPLALVITILSILNDLIVEKYSTVTIVFLCIWGLSFLCILLDKIRPGRLPLVGTLSYAFWVHFYGGRGVIKAFSGKKVSFWGKAASNR